MVQEVVDYAAKTEGKGEVVGLGIRSEEIKGVSHDTLWRSMMESIREPSRFFACSNVSITECKGFLQRTMTVKGETYSENIYSDEPSCEIVYRKLVNGSETDIERVVALRSHPLQIEFHQRSTADGFRVQWDMPKSAPLGSVEAFVREARRMDGVQPTTVSYGITSDPIRDLTYDSLFAAVDLSIKEPWRVIDVDQAGCSVEDCDGYTLRKMKLSATGVAGPEMWSVCSPSTPRSALSSTSAAPAVACVWIGRHRTMWLATPSRTLCSWPRRCRTVPPMWWGTGWPPSPSPA